MKLSNNMPQETLFEAFFTIYTRGNGDSENNLRYSQFMQISDLIGQEDMSISPPRIGGEWYGLMNAQLSEAKGFINIPKQEHPKLAEDKKPLYSPSGNSLPILIQPQEIIHSKSIIKELKCERKPTTMIQHTGPLLLSITTAEWLHPTDKARSIIILAFLLFPAQGWQPRWALIIFMPGFAGTSWNVPKTRSLYPAVAGQSASPAILRSKSSFLCRSEAQ